MKQADFRQVEKSITRLIRTNRQTMVIVIENDASVTVRAPKRVSKKEIFDFVRSKKDWIVEKQKEAAIKARQARAKRFVENELFLFLGKHYPLVITEDTNYALKFSKGNFILHSKCQSTAYHIFVNWYKKIAQKYLNQRIEYFSKMSGIKYKTIRINSAQSRWGSCGLKGTINFTWRLLLAPPHIVDYVVVHELAHMRELNHSHKFWSIVKSIFPEFIEARKWLADNGHILNI
ncbi:MAG: M48 family metallopeptidase [Ignavibacteriae bacterium]|nr:M48 family metallopeptidase [Ignavibacteriota bacterium]